MMNYLLTSGFIHAGLLLALTLTPAVNTSQGKENISFNIRHTFKPHEQKPILSTSPKLLIPGKGAGKPHQPEKVDMSDYANRLKAAVDPIWYNHVHLLEAHLLKKYTTIVLLFPDKHGNIVHIKVVKGSGDSTLDALAIQTFREVGQIPIPPESLIKEGIEWEFTIGGRSH